MLVIGAKPGTVKDLGGNELRIGRHSDNDMVLPSKTVSQQHARIILQGDRHAIEDSGSTNGVYVNGVRVEPGSWLPLCHGDCIAMGDQLLLYRSAGEFVELSSGSGPSYDPARVAEEVDRLLNLVPELDRRG